MEIMNLFVTPIGVKLYNATEVSKLVEPFFKEIKDPSNFDKSSYNILDRNGETVSKIRNRMKKDVNEYAEKIGANCDFDVDSSWVFINETLGAHHHSNVPIVSCFYIDASVEDMSIGRLKFLDPRGGVNLYLHHPYYTEKENDVLRGAHPGGKAKASYFNGLAEYPIIPKTGMMLIFPGYLAHYVEKNVTDKNRILIGANWDRKLDLNKIDKNLDKTPRGTPTGLYDAKWQNTALYDYINKNYK
jgi:hypothetical protein